MKQLQSTRRFTLLDGIILIVVVAVNIRLLKLANCDYFEFARGLLAMKGKYVLRKTRFIIYMLSDINSTFLIYFYYLIFVRLRGSCFDRQRLFRLPGFVACLSACVVVTSFVMFLMASDWLNVPTMLHFQREKKSVIAYAMRVSLDPVAFAVASSWVVMAAGGQWYTEADWIDRFGRALAFYIIGVMPLNIVFYI